MTMTLDPNECPCGRDLRLLNEHSDTPKCVACGRLPELCTCRPLHGGCACGAALIPTVAGRMVCDPCGDYQDVCTCEPIR